MAKEKNTSVSTLTKKGFISNFDIIGKVIINDYTFKIDAKSDKSSYIYSNANMLIDCGERLGNIRVEMMGGYFENSDSMIRAFGKTDDGRTDFKAPIEVAWGDRLDEDTLDNIGDMSFLKFYLEKDDKDKPFGKKFLSAYDAVPYVQEHLSDGDYVRVRGTLKYSPYNGQTQIRKNIEFISILDEEYAKDKVKAEFTQTMYLTDDSTELTKDNIDVPMNTIGVNAYVPDYVKEINGNEIRGNYPFAVHFEANMPSKDKDKLKKYVTKFLNAKKNKVDRATFVGEIMETGTTVMPTLEDLDEDVLSLIECGVYTEEEALKEVAITGAKVMKLIIQKPYMKVIGGEGEESSTSKIPDREEDFIDMSEIEDLLVLGAKENKSDDEDDDIDLDELGLGDEEDDDDDLDEELAELEEVKKETKKPAKAKAKAKVEEPEEDDDENEEEEGSGVDWLDNL